MRRLFAAFGLVFAGVAFGFGISRSIRRRRLPRSARRPHLLVVPPVALVAVSRLSLRAYLQAPNWAGVFDGILSFIQVLFEWVATPITWAVKQGVAVALGIVEAFADVTRYLTAPIDLAGSEITARALDLALNEFAGGQA